MLYPSFYQIAAHFMTFFGIFSSLILSTISCSCDREVSSCPELLEFLDLKGHVSTSFKRNDLKKYGSNV